MNISLMSKVDHEILFMFIKTNLEELGYRLFFVISDNNFINMKAIFKQCVSSSF